MAQPGGRDLALDRRPIAVRDNGDGHDWN